MSVNRKTTRLKYHEIWNAFNKFLIKLDRRPESWEERTVVYIAYLSHEGKQSSTLRTYITAIKSVLQADGYHWNEDKYLLSTLTKSCKSNNDIVKTRLPIRKSLLQLLISRLHVKLDQQYYLLLMYRCFFLLQYYGLMRVGELASGNHPVLAKDIHSADNKNKILLMLYTSKTHGKNSYPQQIKISANSEPNLLYRNNIFCPFTATREFLAIRGNYQSDTDPLFVFGDGSPVKPKHIRSTLKDLLKSLNLDSSLYGTHSFRIGRATDLSKEGFSIDQIKRLGRWKSNAIFKYIR